VLRTIATGTPVTEINPNGSDTNVVVVLPSVVVVVTKVVLVVDDVDEGGAVVDVAVVVEEEPGDEQAVKINSTARVNGRRFFIAVGLWHG
jgi:hypoxanthine phosphoribosyltransferase